MNESLRVSVEIVSDGYSVYVLQSLHDAEIPGSISWLPDGAWGVTIGNPVREREIVRSEAEALEWLRTKAKEIYRWEPK